MNDWKEGIEEERPVTGILSILLRGHLIPLVSCHPYLFLSFFLLLLLLIIIGSAEV
jgi:hypothetical protein